MVVFGGNRSETFFDFVGKQGETFFVFVKNGVTFLTGNPYGSSRLRKSEEERHDFQTENL